MKKKYLIALVCYANLVSLHGYSSVSERHDVSSTSKVKSSKIKFTTLNLSLEEIFAKVEKSSSLRFVYILENVPLNKKIQVLESYDSIDDLLNDLQSKTTLGFQINNNQVLVKPVSSQEKTSQIIELKGLVVDDLQMPLMGVDIRDSNNEFITTTNDNGEFSITITHTPVVMSFSYLGIKPKSKLILRIIRIS